MKIVIVTFDEPFFIPDLFIPVIANKAELIKAVIIVPANPIKKSAIKLIEEQLSLMGIGTFIYYSLSYVKKLILIKLGNSNRSIEKVAKRNKIKTYKIKSVNDQKTFKLLRNISPDVVLTQVPEKIEPRILKTAKIGFINKHASLLPKYRGLNPVFWALLKGETETGFTLHFMNEDLDRGAIILQKKIKINKIDSVFSIYHKIFLEAGIELVNIIDKIRSIKPRRAAGGGSYFKNPNKADISKFREKGLKYS